MCRKRQADVSVRCQEKERLSHSTFMLVVGTTSEAWQCNKLTMLVVQSGSTVSLMSWSSPAIRLVFLCHTAHSHLSLSHTDDDN